MAPCFSDDWGDAPCRRELAKLLCERTAQEMKWPNDYFIPADLYALVYFEVSGIDGLESFTVCRELEKETGGNRLESTEG